MFHVPEVSVTTPSSTATGKTQKYSLLIGVVVALAASACIFLVLFSRGHFRADPYIKSTLNLDGSLNKGSRLFRINCAGCHGISAQGLLGPNLHQVSERLNDTQIIRQVIEGRTPPMPSFKMEPQTMADLLKYLHSIN